MSHPRLSRLAGAATALALPLAAAAQEGSTTLVLDGSGSMWGQIEGVAKITIAQEALRGLLAELPADQALGLVAYGHRERGQCGDIETLVEAGPGTRDRILEALGGISPKGKTPLSDAVLHAAEGLKYTEERATVILISDGIETCDADPCAVGRRLEETGIDFTAHVIGFDVDGEAAAQLECLAGETGGQFLLAEDAGALSDALQQVAAAPPPPPEPVAVTFRAELEGSGEALTSGVIWTVAPEGDGGALIENDPTPGPVLELDPGTYTAGALWTETEEFRETTFLVDAAMDPFTVTVAFAEPQPSATIAAPETAVAGSEVAVEWTGPGEARDYVSVHDPAQDGYIAYSYVEGGSPTALEMPIIPDLYEIRYHDAERGVLAVAEIEVTPVEVSLSPPAEGEVGSTVPVEWTGPAYGGDYIAVSEPGESGYINYVYARDGSPAELRMPGTPGDYEVRYVASQGNSVLARAAISATEATAALAAPQQAMAGSQVAVTWSGPGNRSDYITISEPNAESGRYTDYEYARSPEIGLTMPAEPGEYELRYILSEGRQTLVSRPITVTEAVAALDAPGEAVRGRRLEVTWSGPAGPGDYVSIAPRGAADNEYETYEYARSDPTLSLRLPDATGSYEVRYVLGGARQVIARQPLEVVLPTARLAAPASVAPGASLQVAWQGPGGASDRVVLVPAGGGPEAALEDVAVSEGNPLSLAIPDAAGAYELLYLEGDETLARQAITVE
ncbi:MAG: VWA domain-containing protein [Paracoccaceae bacterium]|jgi:Ca-activated chloride channel family protein|nr:VWA domain-containing protein [Paracoccaceae bacterium]